MLVRCYWCISILIIIPTIMCCSLTGPLCGWSAVVLFDCRYPSFRNFDSTISIDVIRMKSYMYSLFYRSWGSGPINLTSFQIGGYPVSLACSKTAEVWYEQAVYMSCSFILSCIALLVSAMYTLPHSHGSRASFGCTKWDLRVVSDLKTVRTPCCCKQRRRTSDTPFM